MRTDLCSSDKSQSPACGLSLDGNVIRDNTATDGPGGGLLITDFQHAFSMCSTSRESSTGLPQPQPLSQCTAPLQSGTNGGAAGTAGTGSSWASGNKAAGGYGNDLASAAVQMVVVVSGKQPASENLSAAEGASAAPGNPIDLTVTLIDWQGSVVSTGGDSNIVLQVGGCKAINVLGLVNIFEQRRVVLVCWAIPCLRFVL